MEKQGFLKINTEEIKKYIDTTSEWCYINYADRTSEQRIRGGNHLLADEKTPGTLLWNDDAGSEKPHLIITSEQVSKEYLAYPDERHISWIACGKEAKIFENGAVWLRYLV